MESKPDHLSPNFYLDLEVAQIEDLIVLDSARVQELKDELSKLND